MVQNTDQSPRRSWWFWPYWLFCIALSPLLLVILPIAAVFSIPIELISRRRQTDKERQLRDGLADSGRFIPWNDVESHLRNGFGTLIVEHMSPKGPVRDWWTDDDIIAHAPVSLPTAISEPPTESEIEELHTYARECCDRYLDIERGTAKLTEVPVPGSIARDPRKYTTVHLGGGLMTAIILPRGRNLAKEYPHAKVVTLIEWSTKPVLAHGDAESVFLNTA